MPDRGAPALMPLQKRPLFRSYDPRRECWTITRDDGVGKIHIGYVPWLPLTACHHSIIAEPHQLIAEWMRFPLIAHSLEFRSSRVFRTAKFCATCRRQPGLPWGNLLPDGFDPPINRDEAGVISDWWEEHGETARAECIRSWVRKGGAA